MAGDDQRSRRDLLRDAGRVVGALGVGAVLGSLFARGSEEPRAVWQIDPDRCIQCGNCATHCVRTESAVKCVHSYAMCGYCELCTGFFEADAAELTSAAENQLCPAGAIVRTFVEDPYYEYTIDEELCIGCGKCVQGCELFGNGSMFLQVKQDLCLHCNECSIAVACPAAAFVRRPAADPYLLKTGH